ncbi:MAG TPA: VWA domain-containing protein [Woeseiaceae bacterium]|nr:VWA domain-containing protein [Woeseiaceae bacterium]
MIDWTGIEVVHWWPLGLAAGTAALLFSLWTRRRRTLFPDATLLTASHFTGIALDRLPLAVGIVVLLLLTVAMMEPSAVRVDTVERRARDFMILVDTSRSMRHDTKVRRESIPLNFERRVGAFSEAVADPDKIPFIARYELARESLLRFLSGRRAGDRVGLTYFNDDAYPVSALTSDLAFVGEQLGEMDDYVNWGTDIATAMDSTLDILERYPGQNRRTLILLTDAETRYTKELEEQLARLATGELSFYLLWIMTDDTDTPHAEVASFLELARSMGTVVTLENLDADDLQTALQDISRLEAYAYPETRRTVIDLSESMLRTARMLLIVWLPLMATVFHPATGRREFEVTSR